MDIYKTGINIDTVKESKLKLHDILKNSESIHLNILIDTAVLLKPTSKKVSTDIIVVIKIELHVINCEPVVPIFLPKNPETIEPTRGKNINVKYII